MKVKKQKPQIKITTLYDTKKGLMGLDSTGTVYVYQGAEYGWSKLNMSLMSANDVKKKWDTKGEVPF